MRKLFSLLAAVLFAGSMMADGLLFEQTYPGNPSEKVSSYSKSFTLTTGDYTLTYANINNGSSSDSWDAVRAGSKNGASVATVTTEAIAQSVSKVVVNFTQVTAAKTNALSLKVASDATFADAVVVNATIATGEVAFVIAEPAENKFYQIVIDMAQGSANGFNRWDKIQFFTPGEGGGEPIVVVYDTLNVAQAIDTASALADNAKSKKFYIEGYAVNVAAYSTQYSNQDFYLVDDVNAPDSVLQAFRATPKKNDQAYPVLAGDKVRLFGQLQKYVKSGKTQLEIVSPTVEFLIEAEGDRTIEEPEPEKLDTITVKRALEIGAALASGATTDSTYVIAGYVSSIKDYFSEQYKNETFWIVDTMGQRAATNADGAFEVYRGVPTPAKEIGLDAFVYVTSKITNYSGVLETPQGAAVNVVAYGPEEEIPQINVDSALKIGKALPADGVSELRYEITGYVSNVYTFFNPDFKNETVWITDDPTSTSADKANAFEIYRGKPSTQAEVGQGAKVKIVCKIKNFKGTIENDGTNITFEVLEPSTFVPDTVTIEDAISMTANLADGEKLATYSVVKGFVRTVTTPYDAQKNTASFELADYATGNAALATAYQATILKADAEKVAAGSYAVVTGYLMKHGSATQIAQGAITAFEEAPTFDTIYATPSEAQAAGMALEDNKRTQNVYVVTGYVVSANSYDPEDDDFQTFLMADEKGGQAIFKALNAKVPGNGVKVGDQVTLTGNVFKYVEGADISIYIQNGEVAIIPAEGIENVVLTEEIQKVIVDGVLYIIRDGKMFNAQGVQVR